MLEPAEEINAILWLIVAGISLIPLCIFLISYIRVKSKKLLITTAAFAIFFIKAMLLAMKLFIPGVDSDEIWYLNDEFWWSVAAILDMIIIGLIAFALKKKT
jgi:hypothetical protein